MSMPELINRNLYVAKLQAKRHLMRYMWCCMWNKFVILKGEWNLSLSTFGLWGDLTTWVQIQHEPLNKKCLQTKRYVSPCKISAIRTDGKWSTFWMRRRYESLGEWLPQLASSREIKELSAVFVLIKIVVSLRMSRWQHSIWSYVAFWLMMAH